MKADKLRKKYLEFFKIKSHAIIPSGSLVPENDPTVLFTTAGMHPLVPFLLGEKHPLGKRLANVQKCIRTGDIEEVGDDTHLTFFEMLGNWSLGDYFKKEVIKWSWEFLTSKKWLGLDKNKIAISCFKGDKNASKDVETAEIWKSLGVSEKRIAFLPKEDNWWGPAGNTGPCGPDTEMFYWVGDEQAPEKFDPEDERWVEIWNDVFMQYNKTKDGNYEELKQKNVDTGMGLERTAAILQGKKSVYETELFTPIIKKIEKLSKKKYGEKEKETRAIRIITDHLKAATFILSENVAPSNTEQGYVLRRLIRRSIRYGKILMMQNNFTKDISEIIIDMYPEYKELKKNKNFILKEIENEENRFRQTLASGLRYFNKIIENAKGKTISGKDAFLLYQSYGFPIEITWELAKEKNLKVDMKGYEKEFKKHQELSRTATEGKFKAGLADKSEETTKLHTATHLLLSALKKVLDKEDIMQKGSNITAERLRFDFNFDRKLTQEELKEIEDLVNEKIKESIEIKWEEIPLEEAKKRNITGSFKHKYGEKVKVYSIGNFSKEICGGPHVNNTKNLGHFKIKKEESVSAGVRRIKAVLE